MRSRGINKVYLYTAFALIMLIMSWESNLANAAIFKSTIPEQSIRIRILANSDRVEDQWIKKQIRDVITAQVSTWSLSTANIEEARQQINEHLPELHILINELLVNYNYPYRGQVELDQVHFPVKIFGNVTYPAGEYEALRVTLGAGQGQNWWCVLFPPLCFGSAIKAVDVDADLADIVKAGSYKADTGKADTGKAGSDKAEIDKATDKADSDKTTGNISATERVYQAAIEDGDDVEINFYVWEQAKKFGSWMKRLST